MVFMENSVVSLPTLLIPSWSVLYELSGYMATLSHNITTTAKTYTALNSTLSALHYMHCLEQSQMGGSLIPSICNGFIQTNRVFPGTHFYMSYWFNQLFSLYAMSYFGWFFCFIYMIYIVMYVSPLAYLYFHGPKWPTTNIGWSGMQPHDICGYVTGVTASHWIASSENYNKCLELVENQFHSFLVVTQFITYVYLLFIAFKILFRLIKICCAVTVFNKEKYTRDTLLHPQ